MDKKMIALTISLMLMLIAWVASILIRMSFDLRIIPTVNIPEDVNTSDEVIDFIYDSYDFLKDYKLQCFDLQYDADLCISSENNSWNIYYFGNPNGIFRDTVEILVDFNERTISHIGTINFDSDSNTKDFYSSDTSPTPEEVAKYALETIPLHEREDAYVDVSYNPRGMYYWVFVNGKNLTSGYYVPEKQDDFSQKN